MEYRRLGRTGLDVSAVGFGTNELRLVPERQAIQTLIRGFELGVNIVHTSPDYEGAEDLVARAVAEWGRPVIVASQAYDIHYNSSGPVRHFEQLFDATCAKLRTDRLDLYGIASVDDREAFGENVWGPGGMVEFLLQKKQEGRLGSIFCTSHGEPAFLRRVVESDVFDAVMLSYNPLGFHLLSLNPPPGRHFENVVRNKHEIFPLCRERDVGVMVMMPLAGGLISQGKAFPAVEQRSGDRSPVTAETVLRTILEDQNVACVLPGTASLEEAEENARAGHAPLQVAAESRYLLSERLTELQGSHCRRCGTCDSLCSQDLPASWLFRAHDMATHPGERFETWADVEYFRIHPEPESICASCPDVTCTCPYGIDVPQALIGAHSDMVQLMEAGLVPPPQSGNPLIGDSSFGARKVLVELPDRMDPGQTVVCVVQLENAGSQSWFSQDRAGSEEVVLRCVVNRSAATVGRLRQDVHPGERGHFVFELTAPGEGEHFRLRLRLQRTSQPAFKGPQVYDANIPLTQGASRL